MMTGRLNSFIVHAAIACFLNLAPSTGLSQNVLSQEETARAKVSFLMARTIDSSKTRLADGTNAVTMPVLPSEDDSKQVLALGEVGVKVLASYLESNSGLEQHVALRFLFPSRSDTARSAVIAFAEKSKFDTIRQEAIAGLAGFPAAKVRLVLERLCNTDPSATIRETACRARNNFLRSRLSH